MTYPLSTQHNEYWKRPKCSTIYTPYYLSEFLYETISSVGEFSTILDPAIGAGSLTYLWRTQSYIIGIDIDETMNVHSDYFIHSKFEEIENWYLPKPDLVLCNPPFNGAKGKKLYPEIFLRQIVKLFGPSIPTVMFVPMGLRLNQRKTSKRWRWLRGSGMEITSIISLPIDVFEGVLFHSEILVFNIEGLNAHYWLEVPKMVA